MAEKETKKVTGCEIRSCSCNHEFQDKTYGKGMRVKNKTLKGCRCTVCNKDS